MKNFLLMTLLRFWPPFWGAGIRVKEYTKDFTYVLVEMKMRFWNKNYFGKHFGGSLFSMTDPFYMLMLIKILGPNYIIWDKAATIRFKKPGEGTVSARFELSPEQIVKIRTEADQKQKIEPEFLVEVKNKAGEVVAEVEKKIYIKRKA